jgi:hypothetical protein
VLLMLIMFGAEGGAKAARALITTVTVFAQILFLSAIVPSILGLYSGLSRWLSEEWRYRPRLEVECNPDENGFRTEGIWNESDTETSEIYIRARRRNMVARR